jgi:protoheme IX farnesyltransferase
MLYLVSAALLGGGVLVLAIMLAREKTLASARRLFWFSNYYLALLFAAMVIDHLWH